MDNSVKTGKKGLPPQVTISTSGQVYVDLKKLIESDAVQVQVRALENLIATTRPAPKVQSR